MKPYFHARISAHAFGGNWRDYLRAHDFFDQSKGALPDMRHRMMLHSDLGCRLAEQVLGTELILSDGQAIDARDIYAQHQEDDVGRIVPVDEWLSYVEKPSCLKIRRRIADYDTFREDPVAACAARWGGEAAAYAPIIAWFDQTRGFTDHPLADLVLINAFGIMLSEQVFGPVFEVGPDRFVPTRDVGEALALARFGRIPTLEQALSGMRTEMWMYGSEVAGRRKARRLGLDIPITD